MEVFPSLELDGEQLALFEHDAVEKPVELLGVDSVWSLDLSRLR